MPLGDRKSVFKSVSTDTQPIKARISIRNRIHRTPHYTLRSIFIVAYNRHHRIHKLSIEFTSVLCASFISITHADLSTVNVVIDDDNDDDGSGGAVAHSLSSLSVIVVDTGSGFGFSQRIHISKRCALSHSVGTVAHSVFDLHE